MKPSAFALLVLIALLLGGAVGGFVGYSVPERPPTGGGVAQFIEAVAGENVVREAYESDRRKWGAGGIAAGTLLGLISAGIVGSYSLRHRAMSRGETR